MLFDEIYIGINYPNSTSSSKFLQFLMFWLFDTFEIKLLAHSNNLIKMYKCQNSLIQINWNKSKVTKSATILILNSEFEYNMIK